MSGNNYHHGDLKDALIQSARKIISEKGADELSLRAIAAEVGVSHMAPYTHFKNKKVLFQSVAASGFSELAERMCNESQQLTSPSARILAYGVTYIQFAIDHPQLYRLMLGQVESTGRRFKTSEGNIKMTFAEAKGSAEGERSSELETSSRRPFDLLSAEFANLFNDEKKIMAQAIGAWSMVHGMAALIIEGHFSIPESMSIKELLSMAVIQVPGAKS